MTANLTCIGECMLELSSSNDGGSYNKAFAGDTLNTAWYAKLLLPDWNVRFVSSVGQDSISDQMMAFLANADLDIEHIQRRSDRSIGLYMIELENGERSFSYWRDRSAARLLAEDTAKLAAAVQGEGMLYFSGITLAILEGEGQAHLLSAVANARAQGQMVVFDPNLRRRLWSDTEKMCNSIMQAAAICDVVLPSYDDEAEFFGDADPSATLKRYLDVGAKTIVVKNGDGIIHYHHDGQAGQVSPCQVAEIIDSTAAGDSFNAGFLAALETGSAVETAIEKGCTLASKVIGQKGALVRVI